MVLVPAKLALSKSPHLGRSEQAFRLVLGMPARRALCLFSFLGRSVTKSSVTTSSSARQRTLHPPPGLRRCRR